MSRTRLTELEECKIRAGLLFDVANEKCRLVTVGGEAKFLHDRGGFFGQLDARKACQAASERAMREGDRCSYAQSDRSPK